MKEIKPIRDADAETKKLLRVRFGGNPTWTAIEDDVLILMAGNENKKSELMIGS